MQKVNRGLQTSNLAKAILFLLLFSLSLSITSSRPHSTFCVSLSTCLSFSVFLCLAVFLSLKLSAWAFYVPMSHDISRSVYLYPYLFLSLCLYLYLSICISVYSCHFIFSYLISTLSPWINWGSHRAHGHPLYPPVFIIFVASKRRLPNQNFHFLFTKNARSPPRQIMKVNPNHIGVK